MRDIHSIHRMVKLVAEGANPTATLEERPFQHRVPHLLEAMGSDDLEKLYGDDFTVGGKPRTFTPIDTGAGMRIKNITVRQRRYDERDPKLPHFENSRVYVQSTEGNRILKTAFDTTFGQGKLPQPSQGINLGAALTGAETADSPKEVNAIDAMLALRKPENNPHEAWRSGVLPHVFKHLGMTGNTETGLPHAQWHRKAGCSMCPCSPAFIVHKSGHPLAKGHDIWVETD